MGKQELMPAGTTGNELTAQQRDRLYEIEDEVNVRVTAMEKANIGARLDIAAKLAEAKLICNGPDFKYTKIGQITPFGAWLKEENETGRLRLEPYEASRYIAVHDFAQLLTADQRQGLKAFGWNVLEKISAKKYQTGGKDSDIKPERIEALGEFVDSIGGRPPMENSERKLIREFNEFMAGKELTPYKPPPPKMEAMTVQEAEEKIEAFLADIHDHFKGRSANRIELRRQLKEFIIAEVQSW